MPAFMSTRADVSPEILELCRGATLKTKAESLRKTLLGGGSLGDEVQVDVKLVKVDDNISVVIQGTWDNVVEANNILEQWVLIEKAGNTIHPLGTASASDLNEEDMVQCQEDEIYQAKKTWAVSKENENTEKTSVRSTRSRRVSQPPKYLLDFHFSDVVKPIKKASVLDNQLDNQALKVVKEELKDDWDAGVKRVTRTRTKSSEEGDDAGAISQSTTKETRRNTRASSQSTPSTPVVTQQVDKEQIQRRPTRGRPPKKPKIELLLTDENIVELKSNNVTICEDQTEDDSKMPKATKTLTLTIIDTGNNALDAENPDEIAEVEKEINEAASASGLYSTIIQQTPLGGGVCDEKSEDILAEEGAQVDQMNAFMNEDETELEIKLDNEAADQCPNDIISKYTRVENNVWYCKHCDFESLDWRNIFCHVKRLHMDRKFSCVHCPKKFGMKKDLLVHESVHSRKYQCSICSKKFARNFQLVLHVKKKHSQIINDIKLENEELPQAVKCVKCDYMTTKRNCLTTHYMRVHSDSRSHQCPVCDKSYSLKKTLFDHLKTHTLEYKCDMCGRVLKTMMSLKNHKKFVHSSATRKLKKYLCTNCGKLCRNKTDYMVHLNKVHLGKRPFKCQQCEMAFFSKVSLTVHSQIHSELRKYSCDLCKKAFKQRQALRVHLFTHQEYKTDKFHCSFCGKVFQQKSSLTRHERVHSGLRPFTCTKCTCTFSDYSVLRRHLLGTHKMTDSNDVRREVHLSVQAAQSILDQPDVATNWTPATSRDREQRRMSQQARMKRTKTVEEVQHEFAPIMEPKEERMPTNTMVSNTEGEVILQIQNEDGTEMAVPMSGSMLHGGSYSIMDNYGRVSTITIPEGFSDSAMLNDQQVVKEEEVIEEYTISGELPKDEADMQTQQVVLQGEGDCMIPALQMGNQIIVITNEDGVETGQMIGQDAQDVIQMLSTGSGVQEVNPDDQTQSIVAQLVAQGYDAGTSQAAAVLESLLHQTQPKLL